MNTAVNWFEIPSVDFDRAVNFYTTVLGVQIRKENFMGTPNGIFMIDNESQGAVIFDEKVRPSHDGAVLYLNTPNLESVVGRIESAGGKVLLPVTDIGDAGYMALFLDTEGNRIGLHKAK